MQAIDLRSLIAGGESLSVEFKGDSRAPLSDKELVEAAVCLANRASGDMAWLLVGVEDNGQITGARPRHEHGRTDPYRLQALIANRTQPPLTVEVEVVTLDGCDVIAIGVPHVRTPVGTADGKYLRRVIGGRGRPECEPFHFAEMLAMQADQGLLDYAARDVPGARWSDLDPLEFERFRKSVRDSKGLGDQTLASLSDVELAKALGAVSANHTVHSIRVLGMLVFGKETALRRFLPTHEAAFQQLAGLQVESNEFFHLPLVHLIDELMARFRARYREDEVMVGMLRVAVPDFPERAFREAIANALVHRDYTQLGAVHVQWHADRIEISNPGGFPLGVNLGNLLVTPPRPRSPLLADALKRAGIVERTARGIDTIFYEQLNNGRPAPDYSRSSDTSVVLVLHGGEASLDFVRLVVEENQAGRGLTLDELLVLNRLWLERQLDTTQVCETIQKTASEARRVLRELVETGLVEARGTRRGQRFQLSAATYRRLGDKAAYVRQAGFDALQHQSMVIQYIRKYGQITRREAADLCKITERQASYLISKMVEAGSLRPQGDRRGRYYVVSKD